MKRLILDTDLGTDDAVALQLLLHAELKGLAKIEMIICTHGNASLEDVSKNVIRMLQVANRTDIPVYKGASSSLIPPTAPCTEFFHGIDGFGDLNLNDEDLDMSLIKKDSYLTAAHALIDKNPGEIDLVCLGPLTSAALLFKVHTDFASKLRGLYIMGGNHKGVGNVTVAAEFNFHADPEAAHIVMVETQCPTYLVTWECCLKTRILMKWRFNELGQKRGKTWALITKGEQSVYGEVAKRAGEQWYACDAILVAAFLYPEEMIVNKVEHQVSVELAGALTRGQVVLDHLNVKPKRVWIVKEVRNEYFKKIIAEAADCI